MYKLLDVNYKIGNKHGKVEDLDSLPEHVLLSLEKSKIIKKVKDDKPSESKTRKPSESKASKAKDE